MPNLPFGADYELLGSQLAKTYYKDSIASAQAEKPSERRGCSCLSTGDRVG